MKLYVADYHKVRREQFVGITANTTYLGDINGDISLDSKDLDALNS